MDLETGYTVMVFNYDVGSSSLIAPAT